MSRKPDDYGYVRFSRKMVDGEDPIWEDPSPFDVRSAWADILFYTRFAPGVVGGEKLERGEFLASVRFLATRWRWGVATVHRFLKRLEKLERLAEQRQGHRGTVYLVVNYELYNPQPSRRGTTVGTPDETSVEHQRNTSGTKIKKDNKEKDSALNALVADGCAIWRSEMGGDLNFGRLKKLYRKLLTDHPPETILAHWRELFRRNQRAGDKQFISPEKWASTFGLYTPPGTLTVIPGGQDEERYAFLVGEAQRGMDMLAYPDWPKYRDRYWRGEKPKVGRGTVRSAS